MSVSRILSPLFLSVQTADMCNVHTIETIELQSTDTISDLTTIQLRIYAYAVNPL